MQQWLCQYVFMKYDYYLYTNWENGVVIANSKSNFETTQCYQILLYLLLS